MKKVFKISAVLLGSFLVFGCSHTKEKAVNVVTRIKCQGTILSGSGVCDSAYDPYFDSSGARFDNATDALSSSCFKKGISRDEFQSLVNADKYRVKSSRDWDTSAKYTATGWNGNVANRSGSCLGIEYIVSY